MKIAIIGSGIAGNVAAYHLCRAHDITVFEAAGHIGGHTHTHDITLDGETYAVDTGFIVFNDWTYPRFIELLDTLGVVSQPSTMSFGVRCGRTGLEYSGRSINTLFAQRRNLLRPSFQRMVRDILRFNRDARSVLHGVDEGLTLGQYLTEQGYSREFVEHYIIPMGAAIWSTAPERMHGFPARYFVQFFDHHGLLSVKDHPQWRVIRGGSRSYVERLTARFRGRIRLNSPVVALRRHERYVDVRVAGNEVERFDQVFIACHSDQALAMLEDASTLEREILGAIEYQENEAVLHTDTSVLPRRRLAWAAWNYHIPAEQRETVAVTYNMNILQRLNAPAQFLVTLNNTAAIAPGRVVKRIRYAHPLYTPEAVAAQQRQHEINGVDRTYFCGAYWGSGFHEDGVASALSALEHRRQRSQNAKLHLRRAS